MNTRYLIELSYDGSRYNGWQKQPGQQTIQGQIEHALSVVLRREIIIMGSGRTDTGVHAEQQFAHFDIEHDEPLHFPSILHSLRGLIPHDIFVNDIRPVSSEFHARFDAISRQYRYQLSTRHNVFQDRYHWVKPGDLNAKIVQNCAHYINGEHDFGSFCKFNPDVNHTRCNVFSSTFDIIDEHTYHYRIHANRFLHNMVRSIVGNLVEVGLGRKTFSEFETMLNNPDRNSFRVSAPAHALFLEKVFY